jgi:hypothetical protein
MSFAPGDPESQLRIAAFEKGLQDLGWVEGRNLRTEYRFLRAGKFEFVSSNGRRSYCHQDG